MLSTEHNLSKNVILEIKIYCMMGEGDDHEEITSFNGR